MNFQTAPRNTILHGDALVLLATLPDACVQTCVTSPPYFGLRDYGVAGQIGLEATPAEYIERMAAVFREVRRVLADDGTLWLNLGDSYAGYHGNERAAAANVASPSDKAGYQENMRASTVGMGSLKSKDLMGMPWRLAFALQDDGWWLRSDIIWSKPNPMPESVTDRPTRAHEYIFLMSKSARYYYDAASIREPALESSIIRAEAGYQHAYASQFQGSPTDKRFLDGKRIDKQRGHGRRHDGFNDHWDAMSKEEQGALGANKRSVWSVATHPFAAAHFATFPPKLIEPCILAGSRVGDLVLDPFMGAGTTALVALQWQRHYLGLELSADYIAIAEQRIAQVQPHLFATASEAGA